MDGMMMAFNLGVNAVDLLLDVLLLLCCALLKVVQLCGQLSYLLLQVGHPLVRVHIHLVIFLQLLEDSFSMLASIACICWVVTALLGADCHGSLWSHGSSDEPALCC